MVPRTAIMPKSTSKKLNTKSKTKTSKKSISIKKKPSSAAKPKEVKKANSADRRTQKQKDAQKAFNIKAGKLMVKGKERGFVTYDEILKEFPTIESDITFLDDLYGKFAASGI